MAGSLCSSEGSSDLLSHVMLCLRNFSLPSHVTIANPNSMHTAYEPAINEVVVPVLNRDLCNEWLDTLNVTEGMICAGYEVSSCHLSSFLPPSLLVLPLSAMSRLNFSSSLGSMTKFRSLFVALMWRSWKMKFQICAKPSEAKLSTSILDP